jgi:hypothetical protein
MPGHKPNCKCLTCGKGFFKYPSQIKNGSGKYCSRKCAYSSDAWKENIGKGNALQKIMASKPLKKPWLAKNCLT